MAWRTLDCCLNPIGRFIENKRALTNFLVITTDSKALVLRVHECSFDADRTYSVVSTLAKEVSMATQSMSGDRIPASLSQRISSDKHLIFSLGFEEFGIQVFHVKEIIGMQEVTAIPKMPAHVKGVINLRGQVIPVIDLSLKFAFPSREYTHKTCIIIVRNQTPSGERLVGAIADGVTEVLTISANDIEQSPDFGSGAPVPYLLGMAKVRDKVKLILDVDQVFSADALMKLEQQSLACDQS